MSRILINEREKNYYHCSVFTQVRLISDDNPLFSTIHLGGVRITGLADLIRDSLYPSLVYFLKAKIDVYLEMDDKDGCRSFIINQWE